MRLFDPTNPNESKKAILAAVLGLAAVVLLGYVFFGSTGTSKKAQTNRKTPAAQPQPANAGRTAPADATDDDFALMREIPKTWPIPPATDPNRNIFAYYEPPPPPVRPPPTPTPTPPPPLVLTSLAPSSVYARTADFSLEVMGDKFTPALRVAIDGGDLPTRFINAQQVATTVPAALITNPGTHQVMVRSGDGKLYSNTATLNVTPPPVPNYNYIGIIGKRRANDIAVLQDKSSKDLLNVQRGDVLSGRFRVTSISEREVVLMDTTLKIKHTLPFMSEASLGNPFTRPMPRSADDEP